MNPQRFDTIAELFATRRFSRRRALQAGGAALAAPAASFAGTASAHVTSVGAVAQAGDQAEAIVALARDALDRYDLNAVILRVTIGGEEVVTQALGESMPGVPATTEMHFRNGAVAIAYMATLLLRLVDQGVVGLDDPLANWLPDLPDADHVTLRMLTNMTAGYPDYLRNQQFVTVLYENPFRQWAPQELMEFGLSTPRVFAPGTNWDYSHNNYVILGQALERIADKPLDLLLQEEILAPLGLRNTVSSATPAIPEPALHAFTSERRGPLGIPDGTRFYEESTSWSPSWSIAEGAIQTTNIYDMAASAEAIGEGTLLSPASHAAQVAPDLLGFGAPLEGCYCRTLDEQRNYGLGIKLWGSWLVQDPLLFGFHGVMAYLPAKKLAVAVEATYGEQSFVADAQGNITFGMGSQAIVAAIGDLLAPDDPLPIG